MRPSRSHRSCCAPEGGERRRSRAMRGVNFLSRTSASLARGRKRIGGREEHSGSRLCAFSSCRVRTRRRKDDRILTPLTAGPYSHGNPAPTTPFQEPVTLPTASSSSSLRFISRRFGRGSSPEDRVSRFPSINASSRVINR